MSNTIQIKRGSGTPTTSNTSAYELAYDYTNNKLYIHDGASSSMVEIGGGSDAETLDGINSTSFLRSDADDTASGDLTLTGVVNNTNNLNVDGPNFNVSTTNKTTAEYAYRVDRSGSVVGGILIDGKGAFASGSTVDGNTILTSASTLNASNLGSGTIPSARIHRPEPGDWFDGTPVVASGGAMEIGRYIDFHNTDTTTDDYDVRLDNSGSNQLDIQTGVGYIRLGPQNTSWSHIYTDRQGHLFNVNPTSLDGKFQSYSGVDLNLRRSQGDTDRLLIQSGISTFSQSLHVEKGLSVDPKVHSLNSDARYHVNVLSHRDNTNRSGAFIIDTDIARTSNRMSVIHVHGHGYGQHAVIDFKICFYPYSGQNGPDGNSGNLINYSLIDDGNDGRPKFVGINSSGNVAIAIDDYNGSAKYFWHFQVDWYNGTSPVQTPTWSVSNSTTDGFGWIQERVLKPPIKQKRESNNVYEICTNGKLAVNQDYASEELDVNGVGKFRGDSQGSLVLELGQQTGYSGAEDTQLYTISSYDNAGGIRNVDDHLQISSVRWGQNITFARNGQGGAVPTARFYNSSSNGYMQLYKSTNPTSDATYTTQVHLDVNGSSYLNGGNLGIGTSSPSVKTHIKDASNDLYLRLETDKTNGNAQVQYFNDARQYNVGINNADKFAIYDNTAGATRFDIASDGDFKFYGTNSNFESVLSGGNTYLMLSGTATQRIEFRNTDTSANGWIGIPSWNTDAFFFYGPTSNANELAYIYEASRHNFYRGLTVNNNQEDYDFIVKGDGDANLIRTDAAVDKVGIGTSTPDTKLDITASGVNGLVINQDAANADISSRLFFKEQNSTIALYNIGDTFSFRTGATINSTSGTQRFYVNTDGIGVVGKIVVSSSIDTSSGDLILRRAGSNNDRIVIEADQHSFYVNGTKRFEVKGDGTVQVNGTLNATSDVVAFFSSDKKLKDNLKPINNSLEKLQKLTGYEFDWNDKQNIYQGHDVGIVAQEVEKVLPEVVATRDSGYKAVKYEKMIPLLIEAIKEQQQQINELKEKLNG